ncbi:hypothetical protein GCM10027343_41550 [Noviherbaspirillum agri]
MVKATLNKFARATHPDFGRSAALHILAMVPPWLRFAPCVPSRIQARAIAGLVQRSLNEPGAENKKPGTKPGFFAACRCKPDQKR